MGFLKKLFKCFRESGEHMQHLADMARLIDSFGDMFFTRPTNDKSRPFILLPMRDIKESDVAGAKHMPVYNEMGVLVADIALGPPRR